MTALPASPGRSPRPEADASPRAHGSVAALVAAFDWASTPLGPGESWPQSLRKVVDMRLSSRFSMWMGWGPELTFFYNDAYRRDTLGVKHPWALGRPFAAVLAEMASLAASTGFADDHAAASATVDAPDGLTGVRVSDTGIGIPREKLAMIFDPFVQVHRDLTRSIDGTGLGLVINRDLAVESVEGVGSRFVLSLPAA